MFCLFYNGFKGVRLGLSVLRLSFNTILSTKTFDLLFPFAYFWLGRDGETIGIRLVAFTPRLVVSTYMVLLQDFSPFLHVNIWGKREGRGV